MLQIFLLDSSYQCQPPANDFSLDVTLIKLSFCDIDAMVKSAGVLIPGKFIQDKSDICEQGQEPTHISV